MSATNIRILDDDTRIKYSSEKKQNTTQLQAKADRATIANMQVELVLPNNEILTVDISFDNHSNFNNNAMMVIDDFGAELVADAFESRYGIEAANLVRKSWYNKEKNEDPRKPTYMFIKKPEKPNVRPGVIVACGTKDHENNNNVIL